MGCFQSCAYAKEKLGFHWPAPKACRIQKDFVPLHPHTANKTENEKRPMGIARTANRTTNQGHKLVAYHVTMSHWRAMPIPMLTCRVSLSPMADTCAAAFRMVTYPESHHADIFCCGVPITRSLASHSDLTSLSDLMHSPSLAITLNRCIRRGRCDKWKGIPFPPRG